jgi:hypothetical protein
MLNLAFSAHWHLATLHKSMFFIFLHYYRKINPKIVSNVFFSVFFCLFVSGQSPFLRSRRGIQGLPGLCQAQGDVGPGVDRGQGEEGLKEEGHGAKGRQTEAPRNV